MRGSLKTDGEAHTLTVYIDSAVHAMEIHHVATKEITMYLSQLLWLLKVKDESLRSP